MEDADWPASSARVVVKWPGAGAKVEAPAGAKPDSVGVGRVRADVRAGSGVARLAEPVGATPAERVDVKPVSAGARVAGRADAKPDSADAKAAGQVDAKPDSAGAKAAGRVDAKPGSAGVVSRRSA